MNIVLQPPTTRPDFWNGFTVEHEDIGLGQGYLLKKGEKQYSLLRNKVNTNMFFLVGDSLNFPKIKGFSWFKETIEGETITITPNR
jgi:hypothetical protein